MHKLILLSILAFAGPPVPVGTITSTVESAPKPAALLSACLAGDTPRPAEVSLEVLALADGDDQQVFRLTLLSHAHEDVVACLRDGLVEMGGGQ